MADTGKTAFDQYDLIPLKHMLQDSNPGRLSEVSGHWSSVHEELQQAAQDLQKAVEHATQNWQGVAADGFVQRAGQLQTKMTNTAEYARTTADAMGSVAKALDSAKTTMANISVPSSWDSGWKDVTDGFDHSDAQFKADLASGMDRISAVNKNYNSLSAMEISHQYAIGAMEYLAPQYTQAASHLVTPGDNYTEYQEYPPPPANPTPPGGIPSDPMPQPRDPGSTGNNPSGHHPNYVNPNGPGHAGTPGSPGDITTLPNQPTGPNTAALPSGPSTGIDSWAPPAAAAPSAGTSFGGTPGLGTGPGIGGGGGGPSAGGIGNVPIGGTFLGTPGSSRAGGAGGATGTGAHGPGGVGGGKGGAAGGKAGGLAKRSGGAVGGARSGKASGRAFTEGGTGLGRNRPGQNGMGGAHGAQGNKKDRKDGKRPDYLVEDEETWQTNDPVNPPVIE